MKHMRTLLPALIALVLIGLSPQQALAHGGSGGHGNPGPATIKVGLAAPEGVAASVTLAGPSPYVATKPAPGTGTVTTFPVKPGPYKVKAETIALDGTYYTPQISAYDLYAASGRVVPVWIKYVPVSAVTDFHADAVQKDSITLTWSPAWAKLPVQIRRTKGDWAPQWPNQGTPVRVIGNQAADTGLTAGEHYSYSLFSWQHGRMVGPLVLRAGTVSDDPAVAAYIANPQTLILSASQVAQATPNDGTLSLTLAAGVATPNIGAAVVVPIVDGILGGYLGKVSEISADGRTLTLVGAGLSDAFDYYDISIPSFTAGDPSVPDPDEVAAPTLAKQPARVSSGPVTPEDRTPLTAAGPASQDASTANAVAAAAESPCDASGETGIHFSPKLKVGGHFQTHLDKYHTTLGDVPSGASFDVGTEVTVTGAISATANGAFACDFKVPGTPITQQLSIIPVPILLVMNPVAQVNGDAAIDVSNIGITAKTGMNISGYMGFNGKYSATLVPSGSATPLTPKVMANGKVAVKLGGQLEIGPGAGLSQAGAIVSVSGELDPLDATFNAAFDSKDARFNTCVKAEANFSRALAVKVKAWIGSVDATAKLDIPGITGSSAYGGSPWFVPKGCNKATVPQTPSGAVLGTGVTKVQDDVAGAASQWGYVDGFVPGAKSWVLSTGTIADAVGSPNTLASTDLSGAGDADLTALSGHETYDAVSYNVTLVPTGSTLHVRYAFASEEYPDFVGSNFNDVMAVYVNGQNCAKVPGTDEAVSVNTINAGRHADLFIENPAAAGYATTMNGLTKPLECAVPVTPGKAVTVKIGLADASDRILDSAVTLLDGGIWAD